MASAIDICNLALAHLGDPASVAAIDPPEGSAQARYCSRYYPVSRDLVLEAHPWSFNTRRAALTSVALPGEVEGEWLFAYTLPANCLRPFAIYVPGSTEQNGTEDFAVEALSDGTPVVLTNVEGAYAKYVIRVTDTTRYPPSVVDAMSRLLARYLAGPMTKDVGQVETQEKLYQLALARAKALDSNAQSNDRWREERKPGWIENR